MSYALVVIVATDETIRRREYFRERNKRLYVKSKYARGDHPNNHKPRSEDAKRKTSESLRKTHAEKKWGWGISPAWNKGMKGFRAGIPRHEYSDKWKEKVLSALQKYYLDHDVWNKGLTGENDHRLRNLSDAMRKKNPMHDAEIRKKVSISIQGVRPEDWKGFIAYGEYDEKFNKVVKSYIRSRDKVCKL